jgi:hypothetical protein
MNSLDPLVTILANTTGRDKVGINFTFKCARVFFYLCKFIAPLLKAKKGGSQEKLRNL